MKRMLGLGLMMGRKPLATYGDEVSLYVSTLESLSYTLPSFDNLMALDRFVLKLKAAGAWDLIDYISVGEQDSNSINPVRVNLKNPSDTVATVYNAVSFTNKVGTTGDAVSAYIDTAYNPAAYGGNWTLNNAGILLYMHSAGALQNALVGGDFADTAMRRRSLTIHRVNGGTNNLNSVFDFTATPGVKAMYRNSSTALRLYNNKTGADRTQTSDSIRNMNMLIHKDFGTFGAHTVGTVIFGASLDSVHSAVVDALEDYVTEVAAL